MTSSDGTVLELGPDKAVATPVQAAPENAPTAPPAVDPAGHIIDEWGLPLAGPLRARALGGKPDPALGERDRWGLPVDPAWRKAKLKALGRRDPDTNLEDWT